MIHRSRKLLVAPLMAMCMTLAMAASVGAADVSLNINFGKAPRWQNVPGTSIREIRQGDRTDYDMFRYGRTYYAYNNVNGRWYRSRNYRGRFMMIDDRSVPRELRRIPRNHWRNYPTAWEDRDSRGSYGSSTTFEVSYGTRPRWSGVSGTSVQMVSMGDRPNYDAFRYGGNYYVYNDNRWYTSSRESGQFVVLAESSVPTELTRVPRENWRNYPTGWDQDDNGNGNGNGNRGRGRGNQGRGRGNN